VARRSPGERETFSVQVLHDFRTNTSRGRAVSSPRGARGTNKRVFVVGVYGRRTDFDLYTETAKKFSRSGFSLFGNARVYWSEVSPGGGTFRTSETRDSVSYRVVFFTANNFNALRQFPNDFVRTIVVIRRNRFDSGRVRIVRRFDGIRDITIKRRRQLIVFVGKYGFSNSRTEHFAFRPNVYLVFSFETNRPTFGPVNYKFEIGRRTK